MVTELKQVVYIDGSKGEGGGQVIRTSVALAAITGRTVEVSNIRANRSRPGLQAQHLTSVKAAAAVCDATLHGVEPGSRFLRFEPQQLRPVSELNFDIGSERRGGSAGACTLVAQTVIMPLLFGCRGVQDTLVSISGGTHVPMSPTAEYVEMVYSAALARMGMSISAEATQGGYFPVGGGRLNLSLTGETQWQPANLPERGRLERLAAYIDTTELPPTVAQRGAVEARKLLKGYGVELQVVTRELPGKSPGAALTLVAECKSGLGGWSSLGERGKPMERLAAEAVSMFVRWYATGASVDEHLADQLALPASFIDGESQWTVPVVTDHLRTVLDVISAFVGISYSIDEPSGEPAKVTVHGVPQHVANCR